MKKLILALLVVASPLSAAAIEITEVAWMGSTESANHEWIELFNAGASVDVSGWQLTDGNNLDIVLSGTISADEHVVLERTSDASAPGSAFLVYTGALSNAGATLTLRDSSGAVVDQVVGGEDWQVIGGNNETKDTAQLAQGVWVTQVPSPGRNPSGVTTDVPNATQTETTSDTSSQIFTQTNAATSNKSNSDSGSDKDKIVVELQDSTLQLDIEAPTFAYVNQPVDFAAMPSDTGDTLMASLVYDWNFGDGQTAQGKEVTHAFAHPGRYVVVAAAEYKRQQQVARYEIEILPVRIALSASAGEIAIINVGTTEVDLSEYRLVGRDQFIIPKHTILLPGRTLALDEEEIGGEASNSMVVLYDQAQSEVATLLPLATAQLLAAEEEAVLAIEQTVESILPDTDRIDVPISRSSDRTIPNPPVTNQAIVPKPATPPARNSLFRFASEVVEEPVAEIAPLSVPVAMAADEVTATSQVASFANTATQLPARWPLYTLVGLLLLGIVSIYFIPSYGRGDN